MFLDGNKHHSVVVSNSTTQGDVLYKNWESVYCVVRTESLNVLQVKSVFVKCCFIPCNLGNQFCHTLRAVSAAVRMYGAQEGQSLAS